MRSLRAAAVAILALVGSGLCVACATSIEIERDPRAAFDRYCTWDWIAAGGLSIEGPASGIAGIDRDLAQWVERELARRGFDRVRGAPDLRIGVLLQIQREVKTVHQTGAVEHVSSLHQTPNYQVQRSVTATRIYDHSRFGVIAVDPRQESVVWKGTVEQSFRGGFAPHLEDMIGDLLERFPSASRRITTEGICNRSA